jgi:tRNA (Thr-GGU) A37 N-methylase
MKICWNCWDGIDEYSHLIVLYWGTSAGQRAPTDQGSSHGPQGTSARGIFGTRMPGPAQSRAHDHGAPDRPGGQCSARDGLDAINNSPVIDIKPHVPELSPKASAHAG